MTGLIVEILSILAPGACLALIGLIWARRGPAFPVDFVTTLVMNLSLPALLFHTLAESDVAIGSLGRMVLAALAVHLFFTPVMIGLLKLAGRDWRLCVTHVVGNTGNLGLPVCFFAFGEPGLAFAMTFFAVQCLLLFSVGEALYAGQLDPGRVLRSPILHAVWLGVLVRMLELSLPSVLLETVKLLGQLMIPLMLITLGISLAGMRVRQLTTSLVWALLRTGVAIAIGFLVAELLALEGVARGVLIIETVVPVAVFHFLLARKHGRDAEEVSGLILVSHIASIAYLPIVLGVLLGGGGT